MNPDATHFSGSPGPPPEYEAAMADIEHRAGRGELTLAQAKREIFALREKFAVEAGAIARWAAQSL